MTLDQALHEASKAAQVLREAAADAKAGYSDVLRQVMQHQVILSELRAEVRANEKAAADRHAELMEMLKGGRNA